MLNVNVRLDNVNYQHTYYVYDLSTSNRTYDSNSSNDLDRALLIMNDWDYLFLPINVLADMDASDTAYVIRLCPNAGSAASSDIVGSQKAHLVDI
jgi:hypothetical protein